MVDLLIWGLSSKEEQTVKEAIPHANITVLQELPQADWSAPLLVGNQAGLMEWLAAREEHAAPVLLYDTRENVAKTGMWAYCDEVIAPEDWSSIIAHVVSPHLVAVREAVYALPQKTVVRLPESLDDFDITSLPLAPEIKAYVRDDGLCYAECVAQLVRYRGMLRGLRPATAPLLAISFAGLLKETRQQIKGIADNWKGTQADLQLAFSALLEGLSSAGWAPIPSGVRKGSSDAIPTTNEALIRALRQMVRASSEEEEIYLSVGDTALQLALKNNDFADIPFRLVMVGPQGEREWVSNEEGTLSLPISEWLLALAEGTESLLLISSETKDDNK